MARPIRVDEKFGRHDRVPGGRAVGDPRRIGVVGAGHFQRRPEQKSADLDAERRGPVLLGRQPSARRQRGQVHQRADWIGCIRNRRGARLLCLVCDLVLFQILVFGLVLVLILVLREVRCGGRRNRLTDPQRHCRGRDICRRGRGREGRRRSRGQGG